MLSAGQKRILCLALCLLLLPACLTGCGLAQAESQPPVRLIDLLTTERPGPDDLPVLRLFDLLTTERPEAVPGEELPAEETPPEDGPLTAMVMCSTFLYASPDLTAPGAALSRGETVTVEAGSDPLWFSVVSAGGKKGWIYGECLIPLASLSVPQPASGISLGAAALQDRTADLAKLLPDGLYWNHNGRENIAWGRETPWLVSGVPCSHSRTGDTYCNHYSGKTEELFAYSSLCQCLGFASFVSDSLFGEDAVFHIFNDPALLRVGDHIRRRAYEHSMIVAEVTGTGVTLAEVNLDYETCLISWNRQMTYEELEELRWDSDYLSRYPLCPDGKGGFGPWPADSEPGMRLLG